MAIDDKYIELINAEIDAEISADDQALLDAYIAGNDDAKQLRDQLAGLCSDLDAVDPLSPPDDLQHSVMSQVSPAKKTVQAPPRISFPEFLVSLFGMPPVRYAMSFAAGVILTITLVSSDQTSRRAFDDVTSLVGTMSDAAQGGSISVVDDMQLTLNELAGTVSLNSSGPILILDFDLSSQYPIEIVAAFNDRDIWFNGFAQLESEGTSVAAQSGQVTVRMEGQRRYAVYLHNTGQNAGTVSLRFLSSGQLLYEGTLSFGENN